MEVILLEKIHKLGELGDTVKVKPGYGRNYLIPAKKAVPATPENVKKFDERRTELEQSQQTALDQAQSRAQALAGLTVQIAGRAGAEGKLYGSVGTDDIAHAATQAGVPLEKREVRLPGGPLRELGEFDIEVRLHADVSQTLKVVVVEQEET